MLVYKITRIDGSSERANTMVEIFFRVDEGEGNTNFQKLCCCLSANDDRDDEKKKQRQK